MMRFVIYLGGNPRPEFLAMTHEQIKEKYHISFDAWGPAPYTRYKLTGGRDDIIEVLKNEWGLGDLFDADELLCPEDLKKLDLDK